MIYTSYFSNIKKLPKNLKTVSISRFSPKFFKGETDLTLAPSEELLLGYKEGKISEEEYTKIYKEQLEKLDPKEVEKNHRGHVLCCYEKTGDFCHRHILSEWLENNGIEVAEKETLDIAILGSTEFSDADYIKYRLGQLKVAYPNQKIKILSGGTKKSDKMVERWAQIHGVEVKPYLPDWNNKRKGAGTARYEEILRDADLAIVFFDNESGDIREFIEKAENSGKEVHVYSKTPNELRVEVQKEPNLEDINPHKIYVFGDNLERKGKKGQSILRDLENSAGVATKRLPTAKKEAFFSDQEDEIEAIKGDLREVYKLAKKRKVIVFPEDGIGDDLAKLRSKSPKAYAELDKIMNIFFGMKETSKEAIPAEEP